MMGKLSQIKNCQSINHSRQSHLFNDRFLVKPFLIEDTRTKNHNPMLFVDKRTDCPLRVDVFPPLSFYRKRWEQEISLVGVMFWQVLLKIDDSVWEMVQSYL